MKSTVLTIIKIYQHLIGPVLPRVCRYEPSCSQYALEAVEQYGPWKGGLMSALRILRCNPFFPGGYDPVRKNEQKTCQYNNGINVEASIAHFSTSVKGESCD